MDNKSKPTPQELLYESCIKLFDKLERREVVVNDIVFLLKEWSICAKDLRLFYNYLDTQAYTPEMYPHTPKKLMQILCACLANILFDMTDQELAPVSIRSISNVLKMYAFITERLLVDGTPGGGGLRSIGPGMAAQVYGDTTLVGNLTVKQMGEFILPHFTIIN